MPLRAVYCDLDGTLLGPGGSLLAAPGGGTTLLGARAVEACLRAGVELVPTTGRRQQTASVNARMLGLTSFIFEIGAAYVLDGEEHWLTGDWHPGLEGQSIYDQIEASGAPRLLLDHFAGRLEYHTPWADNREVSHLLRGDVDTDEADALMADRGIAGLRLVDNGPAHHRSDTLLRTARLRVYHLLPQGATKATAVAAHMRARGYVAEETIAIGDSAEDLRMAGVVGRYFAVANATLDGLTLPANATRCAAANGEGVYEAVVSTLAER